MSETTRAVIIAVTASAAAAVTTALITHYLTKQATIQNVASGKQPLPVGSTPTTSGQPASGGPADGGPNTVPTGTGALMAYAPPMDHLLQQAVSIAGVL